MQGKQTDQKLKTTDRKAWISLLAKAPEGRAAQLLAQTKITADFTWLRKPEIGSVMVQGRAGGTGAPFNIGEMTVTRCTLRLSNGVVGHGYVQGRRKSDAETAAVIDAVMQTDDSDVLQNEVLTPLNDEAQSRITQRAEKAAATKVDFFTMVRGED